jgi:hypothetical protein
MDPDQLQKSLAMSLVLFGWYLLLAGFAAGNMTTLQIQHYGIYSWVNPQGFQTYMLANNKSALIPSILPALVLLIINVLFVFSRPVFMSGREAAFSLALNGVALVSTFVWQRRLQGQMAQTGYDQKKINLLLATNWIRTLAYLVQAGLAVRIALHAARCGNLG